MPGGTDAVICQQEIAAETIAAAASQAPFFCLNAAPARGALGDLEPDLLIVNRYEYEAIGDYDGLVALTLGAEGAVLLDGGEEVARARPPKVTAVDGTAAGDAFCAALVVELTRGETGARGAQDRVRGGGAGRVSPRCPAFAADGGRGRAGTRCLTGK